MSSFLFLFSIVSLLAINIFGWFHEAYCIPITFAILCVASNIDDLRKQSKPKEKKEDTIREQW